jgi:hypothetical protein
MTIWQAIRRGFLRGLVIVCWAFIGAVWALYFMGV